MSLLKIPAAVAPGPRLGRGPPVPLASAASECHPCPPQHAVPPLVHSPAPQRIGGIAPVGCEPTQSTLVLPEGTPWAGSPPRAPQFFTPALRWG